MREHEIEPVRGLPEPLPAGEEMLWQGSPTWGSLALRAFHVRKVAIYFGLLAIWRAAYVMNDGHPLGEAVISALWLVVLGLITMGILSLLAWAHARVTVYTITNRRLVIRFGVAFQMIVNFPFKVIESASLKTYANGNGDIPLILTKGQRASYILLWPNVRPWQFVRPQPMLRGIPDATGVAKIFSEALQADLALRTAQQPAEAEVSAAADAATPVKDQV
ncbi:photosynthetic complex putative assembly protein PuhB [Thiorhodospira sibirica]|uniref:photosynthetic complex putative assembly protein PuhB n=1 Tax=Thiorhodospira sibirica TaxID=154347 RepID=UPI00022C39D4|nr:photosynthetic complex putative assembly protein PuhB [Thiorhodospira sibirica]